jgi:glycosyltransferase involved in cell wall biosynthesis
MKFSIGIPAYKRKYIEQCINSILSQNYNDFEVLIVDDCSPEDIKSVVVKFPDKRIQYIRNSFNIGAENVVDNWNKCLNLATGDFFILMGDDDMMEKNYLQEFANLINRYPNLDVFHCRSKIIDHNGNIIELTPSWPEFESIYDNMWHRISEKECNIFPILFIE